MSKCSLVKLILWIQPVTYDTLWHVSLRPIDTATKVETYVNKFKRARSEYNRRTNNYSAVWYSYFTAWAPAKGANILVNSGSSRDFDFLCPPLRRSCPCTVVGFGRSSAHIPLQMVEVWRDTTTPPHSTLQLLANPYRTRQQTLQVVGIADGMFEPVSH
jgi:hypothetical protein